MKYTYTNSLLIIMLFSFCTSCKSKYNGSDKFEMEQLNTDDFQIRKGKQLNPKDWHCYDIQYDKICCPIEWKPAEQKFYLFFSKLNDTNENTFFVVIRYDKEMRNISLDNYVKEVYSQLRDDTVEVFIDYMLKELLFKDKRAFYGEFMTEITDSSYVTFSMYTEHNGMIYDFSLKVPQLEREAYYSNFQDILYNYSANGDFIFSEKDELKAVRAIAL